MKKLSELLLNTRFSAKGLFVFFSLYLLVSSIFIYSEVSAIIRTPLVLANYIIIFGSLISLNIGLSYKENKLNFFLYSVGLSLISLMSLGLLINYLFPFIGIVRPLAPASLLITFGFIILLLAYILYKNSKNESFHISFTGVNIHLFIPIVFLIISSIGTSILNSIGDNRVILLLAPSIVLYNIYLFLNRKNFSDSVYISSIFFSALSIILTFSMRGPNIIGWDINEEFQVFSKTLENLRWSMDYYKGLDYNACISITILPTIFQVLTGISPHYIFKFFFQIFFALLPLSVYSISKEYLSSRLSLVTSFLFISQSWFYEQMPALIRQENILFFYLDFY
jgi:uncharacterized membrane protein